MRIVILITTALFCSALQGQEVNVSPPNNTEPQTSTAQTPSLVGEQGQQRQVTRENCVRYARTTYPGGAERIACLDLEQQTRMADSTLEIAEDTDRQASYAFWGIALNIITLAFIGITLFLTKRSTDAAVKQASQDRAWVTPVIPPARDYLFDDKENVIGFEITFKWENSGNSPATNISILSAGYEDSKNLADSDLPTLPSDLFDNKVDIGFLPRSQSIPVPFNFMRDKMERVIRGESRMYVCTIATFETIYEELGTIEHWVEIIYTGTPTDADIPSPPLENWENAPVGSRCKIIIKPKPPKK